MSAFAGPKISTNGLVLALDAANVKSYSSKNLLPNSQSFTGWTLTAVSTPNQVAPDGTTTAVTLTDNSAANWLSLSRDVTIPSDSATYYFMIYVKKTTGGTSARFGLNSGVNGGTSVAQNPRLNTDTGVANIGTTESAGDYWKWTWSVTNNNTNSNIYYQVYPATGVYNGADDATAVGSATIWGCQVTRGSQLLYQSTENIDLTKWYDLSGNKYDTTLTNGPIYSNGGSIVFDGTDDYITTSYIPSNTQGSISVWFNINAHKDYNTIFDNALGANDWEFWVYNTGIARFRSTSDNLDFILDSDVLLTNTYYNFVITWNLSVATMYKNGMQIAQDSTSGTKVTPSFLYFGGGNAGNTKLNGKIPIASIYNRALSIAEIQQNFNALRGRFNV